MTDIEPLVRQPDGATRPRVLAMANQKGGVGKTTTAINLGTALAAIGERVLILDLDPQGNASTGLGIDRKARVTSSYDMLVGERSLRDVVIPTSVPRLFIAPSTMDLLGVELEIAGHEDRSYKLRDARRAYGAEIAGDSDRITYVLVDCPPSLQPPHHQCARRSRRGRRAPPMRILRARGPVATADDGRAGAQHS